MCGKARKPAHVCPTVLPLGRLQTAGRARASRCCATVPRFARKLQRQTPRLMPAYDALLAGVVRDLSEGQGHETARPTSRCIRRGHAPWPVRTHRRAAHSCVACGGRRPSHPITHRRRVRDTACSSTFGAGWSAIGSHRRCPARGCADANRGMCASPTPRDASPRRDAYFSFLPTNPAAAGLRPISPLTTSRAPVRPVPRPDTRPPSSYRPIRQLKNEIRGTQSTSACSSSRAASPSRRATRLRRPAARGHQAMAHHAPRAPGARQARVR